MILPPNLFSSTGQHLRITHIDVFWKKLDFKPARNKIEDIDVDAEFEKLKKQIDPTPPQVKRSFFEKFQQILNPGNSNKKPPAVLKKTRGRPTLKRQEERKVEAARQSSYNPSEETWVDASDDVPRHSSYISAEDSCKGKNTKPLNLHPDFPNIKLGPKTDIAIRNYASQIPKVILSHPNRWRKHRDETYKLFKDIITLVVTIIKVYFIDIHKFHTIHGNEKVHNIDCKFK
ncbi:hypothetical protein Hdeb2414_s0022g00611801 [Helianthus debilis subsp. tardiflorus]